MSSRRYSTHSRLEPTAEKLAKAQAVVDELRQLKRTVVWSPTERSIQITEPNEYQCRAMGVVLVKIPADLMSRFRSLKEVIALMYERKWLRMRLKEADERNGTNALTLFERALEVFPGTRFVRRESNVPSGNNRR